MPGVPSKVCRIHRRVIVEAIKKELQDAKLRKGMATNFDISAPIEKLMSVIAELEALDSEVAMPHCLEPEPRCPWDFSGATKLAPKQLLMAAMSRPPVEPPHEPAGSVVLSDVYAGYAFYADISGAPLDTHWPPQRARRRSSSSRLLASTRRSSKSR